MFSINGQEKGMFFKHIVFLEKGLFLNAMFYDGYQYFMGVGPPGFTIATISEI